MKVQNIQHGNCNKYCNYGIDATLKTLETLFVSDIQLQIPCINVMMMMMMIIIIIIIIYHSSSNNNNSNIIFYLARQPSVGHHTQRCTTAGWNPLDE